MAYSEKVIEHYENPRNVGSFEKGDDHVGTVVVWLHLMVQLLTLIAIKTKTFVRNINTSIIKY